jgi:hypothetical protein
VIVARRYERGERWDASVGGWWVGWFGCWRLAWGATHQLLLRVEYGCLSERDGFVEIYGFFFLKGDYSG